MRSALSPRARRLSGVPRQGGRLGVARQVASTTARTAPAAGSPAGAPPVQQAGAGEVVGDRARPSGDLVGDKVLAGVDEAERHGQDVAYEQRADRPAGTASEEEQEEHGIGGVQ